MIRRHPRADLAIIELAEFIGLDSLDAAERFLDAVETSFALVHQNPGVGRLLELRSERLADLRVWPVRGFPNHLIIYRQFAEGIDIVHVLHGARDTDSALSLD